MKKILLLILSITFVPLAASASSVPDFPMAFYGTATINGSLAPANTIIRAYYGSDVAGQVTVQNDGVYGYSSSTLQKLVVGNGTGAVTFSFQSSSVLSGAETFGSSTQSYPSFEAGATAPLNFLFTYTVPQSAPSAPVPSVAASGGGGGGGISVSPSTTAILPATVNPLCPVGYSCVPIQQCPVGYSCVPVSPVTSSIAAGQTTTTQTSVHYIFNRDLTLKKSGVDVQELQKFLNNHGFLIAKIGAGSLGAETTYFGSLTQAAVARFQKAKGISPAAGYFGPLTRGVVNSL